MDKDILIGVDIGGTTVKNAIISIQGEMIDKWEIPTVLKNGGKSVPQDIWNSIEKNYLN
ncbi:glucokinase [Gracilibacillus boraciitolerans JCM 21714]|uniref:Glucokinase n=1 Tax=Gracilibacillus boraciitolerans JCM 21714 TaxID=1298598 RepID=W4VEM7_9BACI|nr:glucokinase [Gracilibacillus boraciitolerans JCM 21714]